MTPQQLYNFILTQEKDSGLDAKVLSRSTYNMIYGICLLIYLTKTKAIEQPTKLLSGLKSLDPSFFVIDLASYNLDDNTLDLISRHGKTVFNEIKKEPLLPASEFWKKQEEFFISCF